jgi:hypothetical protein
MVVSSRLTGDGEVFAAVSEIWSQEQGTAVTVVYEGDLQALSETMKAAQLAGHKEAARKVCLGVEFP